MIFQDLLLREFLSRLPEWEEQRLRAARVQFLRHERSLRKADAQKLREMGPLPLWAQQRVARIAREGKLGRPTVNYQSLDNLADEFLAKLRIWANPDAPAHKRRTVYRQLPWFPERIEAAYRGELAKLQKKDKGNRSTSDRSAPGHPACHRARDNVAKAAGISPALVTQYAYQVRKAFQGRVPSTPAMTADQLRKYLEKGLFDAFPGSADALRKRFQT